MIGKSYLTERLREALGTLGAPEHADIDILLEKPKNAEHGDVATNVALLLASRLRRNPRKIAEDLLQSLQLDPKVVSEVDIAGPGFINFTFSNTHLRSALPVIKKLSVSYGRNDWGGRRKVQIEFVSANPTGPLNVVSARAATVGDVLANLFDAVGFEVEREYYVNDAGRQIKLLGLSVSARYMGLIGKEERIPEEGYHGDYIVGLAKDYLKEHGEELASADPNERTESLSEYALEKLLASHRENLTNFGVEFDVWFRERALRSSGSHMEVFRALQERNHVYESEGAQWFRSSQFGDEKDRVLITKDGEPTYFLVDVAYHADKYKRGFEMLYDLWGPDHHGYINRVKAALVALGHKRESFSVEIIQQVNLLRDGKQVKMSKRAGRIIEMKDLIEEVGVDVARFFFVTRRNQSHLDFDVDLAKDTSEENPVYYVQYAHARICNIMKRAGEQGIVVPERADLTLLDENQEIKLIKKLLEFPDVVSYAARFLEPHRLPLYLQEVAAAFHKFYHHHRVISEDAKLTEARLILTESTRIVLKNALTLLGISAPERM